MWSRRGTARFIQFAAIAAFGLSTVALAESKRLVEDFAHDPMPAGIQVMPTELEGPVFADGFGKTLYRWQVKTERNGPAGDPRDTPTCDDHVSTETAGLKSPYPAGLELPNIATRPSCAQMWPPMLAPSDAKPVGKWTIVPRKDGRKQWALDGWPLYTSVLDHRPGDVNGGTKRNFFNTRLDTPAWREPVGPRPNIPSQFGVFQTATGRLLGNNLGYSVYSNDKGGTSKSNCVGACLQDWAPVEAPQFAQPIGDFTIFESSAGVRQWAFHGKPLYTHTTDGKFRSFEGGDEPGWHNVYTQTAPAPPKGFHPQDTRGGVVLADVQGKTVYVYVCADDAVDQLACDHPDTEQAYRFAICGGGDVDTCLKAYPYVIAPVGAVSGSQIWSTMDINPRTGHRAEPGEQGALHVWAFRDRPIYTFYLDQKPGDIWADARGEFGGHRNGFKAFWLRDLFRENAE